MIDVTVIGGGPAGTSAAIRLARSGRRVRLYEKDRFPRAKLCGGFLSPEGLAELEDLGVLASLRQAGAVPLYRTVLASRRGTLVESPLPGESLSVSRDTLDHLLLQEASRAGVEVCDGQNGFEQPVESPYTVIASGRLSFTPPTLAHTLTPWYASPPDIYFGIQATFEEVDGMSDQVELDLIESGYVGLARQADHRVNVCTLTTQKAIEQWGPSLDRVMKHFIDENPVLRKHLAGARRAGSWMAVGPVRLGIRQLANENTFYVGDAACVVDPFAGEGMSIGLYTSQLLVHALNQTKQSPADAYAGLWREAFMPALRWNALMRMFYSLSVLREPAMQTLQWFPKALTWMAELTRYRPVKELGGLL